jgi:sec-independent protein translocase protein TatB
MDIFGIGILELVFILIIAMIVVGPRDLGKVGRQVGRFLNRMYKSESHATQPTQSSRPRGGTG